MNSRLLAIVLELDARPFVAAVEKVVVAAQRLRPHLVEYFNHDVNVAGLEATYYVRAAMDPTYASPRSRDELVFALLAGREQTWLTPENRARVAAAVVRGWITHRSGPLEAVAS